MPRVRRCRYDNCHGMAVLPLHYCPKHQELEQSYLKSRQRFSHKSKHYNFKKLHDPKTSEQYRFYRSQAWQKLRLQVLERDQYLCQYCLARGVVTEGNTVDHIVPIRLNHHLMKDINNLATICFYCHESKTIAEQKYTTNVAIPRTVREWVTLIDNQ